MLLREFIDRSISTLGESYPPEESRSIILMLCSGRLGTKSYTHIIEPQTEISTAQLEGLNNDVLRLAKGEPIQYLLGKAEFYGREFAVTPAVLIPRQETEELVSLALKFLSPKARCLDLCTGSGCIAWSVALESDASEVVGVDLSEEALSVAKSQFSDERVNFLRYDVLAEPDRGLGLFDMIVSNPPYILESQKGAMRKNVLDFEPAQALFVEDDKPLIFYEAVGRWCRALLKEGGRCVVEINEDFGVAVAELFSGMGFSGIQCVDDVFGKNRMISFRK